MDRLLFAFLFVLTITIASAQELQKFRTGLGAGWAFAQGHGAETGALFFLEPGYRITDNILLNLRLEVSTIRRGLDSNVGRVESRLQNPGAFSLNGYYILDLNNFKPFVGAGAGMFRVNEGILRNSQNQRVLIGEDALRFGYYPTVGFEIGILQVAANYYFIRETVQQFEENTISQQNSYFSFRAGVIIGGGRL